MREPCFMIIGRFDEKKDDDFLSELMTNMKGFVRGLGANLSGYCDSYNLDFVVWSNNIIIDEKIRQKVKDKFEALPELRNLTISNFIEQSEVFENVEG